MTFVGHTDKINACLFVPHEPWIISASSDSTIRIWNTKSGHVIFHLNEHKGPVMSISLSRDGKILVSGSEDKTIKIWNVSDGKVVHTIQDQSPILCVCISPTDPKCIKGKKKL